MKQRITALSLCLFLALLALPTGASDCEVCRFTIVCQGTTDCMVVEYCGEPRGARASALDCWVDGWGLCHESSEFCLLV